MSGGTFEEQFPSLKIIYRPMIPQMFMLDEKVTPFVYANQVQKNCIDKQRVREVYEKTIREANSCFTGLTADTDSELGMSTVLDLLESNFKELGLNE